jgi:predicted aspartyl protease
VPIVRVEYTRKDPGGGAEQRAPEALILKGPLLPIAVGPALAPGQPISTHSADRTVPALIDTGASVSCIDEKLASQLSLRVIDRCKIGGVAGQKDHDVYLGKLVVAALGLAMNGRLIGVTLGPETPIIVGRDFLAKLILIYDGTDGTIKLVS